MTANAVMSPPCEQHAGFLSPPAPLKHRQDVLAEKRGVEVSPISVLLPDLRIVGEYCTGSAARRKRLEGPGDNRGRRAQRVARRPRGCKMPVGGPSSALRPSPSCAGQCDVSWR